MVGPRLTFASEYTDSRIYANSLYDVLPREGAEDLLRGFYGLSGFTSVKDSLEKGIEGWE